MVTAPRASAISDAEELTRFGSSGPGAGQLNFPYDIASDPNTGHAYVVGLGSSSNNRIDEFTPWGGFVKAFGWDVAPGAVNEQQEVRVRAGAGQFQLSFGASTTADLAFDAPGAEGEGLGSVEAALNALPSVSSGGGSVSVEAVPGAPNGSTPYIYVIAFKGALAGTNVAQLTATNGATPLTGGDPSTTLEVRTRADGTAASSGLESCTVESGCQKGLAGSAAGELGAAFGIAVDTSGDIYIRENENGTNNRVQKFSPSGRFLLMIGGEVNKTTGENLCTAASGDECGVATSGTGPGQFSSGSSIDVGPTGTVFVPDAERIQRFNSEGEFEASVPTPGENVVLFAIDPESGDLYATFQTEENVHRLDPDTGTSLDVLEVNSPRALATDSTGNVYVVEKRDLSIEPVLQFDSNGKPLSPPSCCLPPAIPGSSNHFNIYSLGTNAAGDLYAGNVSAGTAESFIRLFGPAPVMFEAPPQVPPSITAQFASSVERDGAVLAATINPHFWTNTRYFVQYGTGKCSEGGCEAQKPVPPGGILTSKVLDAPLPSPGIFLEDLEPGTTYHYRFVAQSGGGGPVRGVGGVGGVDGAESSFTTYPAPAPPKSDCPNQAFRTGFSAPLADCRAFEMVSPVDKNNGDIKSLLDSFNYTDALYQSSTDGNRFTYSSYRAFADAEAAPYSVQYVASRKEGVGWATKAVAAPQGTDTIRDVNIALDNEYKAFSADLCSGWLVVAAEPLLAPGATKGYLDLYRRDNCDGEGYEALVGVEPNVTPRDFNPELQGFSTDGKEAVLRVEDKLTPDAVSGFLQTYYASKGELHLICILPSGSPSGGNCSAGTGIQATAVPDLNRTASVSHAFSADGSRVYWTASVGDSSPFGKVYLRENPGQEQSELSGGKCTEVEKACTLAVSETASTKSARFLTASTEGSKALFEVTEGAQAGNLYEFDREAAGSTLIAGKVLGIAGASDDLSYVYFASTEATAETISEGAVKGRPNLYLAHEGANRFIATLSDTDVSRADQQAGALSNIDSMPIYHVARTSADGRRLAFISTESLTGYDNTDLSTGEGDSEVYIYEAGTPGPLCLSCNPSGARPHGRRVAGNGDTGGIVPSAATIPPPLFQLNHTHPFSADGSRLFFNSYDALLLRDTNGKEDVYEWEAASGPQDCEEKGADLYVPGAAGCLSLVSSGESPSDSEFVDATPSGDDVFITTNASLLPQDEGLIDVYDARVNGGLPALPAPPGPCQGEACQIAPPPPNDPTPASASFRGAGNLKATPRCARGKVARKGRCVAKKRKRAKKRRPARHVNHNWGMSR